MNALQPDQSEQELEAAIHWQAMILHTVTSPIDRRAAMDELRRLHFLRSPRKVAELERERGLN